MLNTLTMPYFTFPSNALKYSDHMNTGLFSPVFKWLLYVTQSNKKVSVLFEGFYFQFAYQICTEKDAFQLKYILRFNIFCNAIRNKKIGESHHNQN